jgi:hypothetical protein
MKRILSIIGLISALGVSVIPFSVVAMEAATSCTIKYDQIKDMDPFCTKGATPLLADHGMCCVMNSIYNITDWIFMILVAIAAIMVLYGAYSLLTGGGNAEKITTGRNYIIYAAVGLAVAFLAKAVPGVVKIIVGL